MKKDKIENLDFSEELKTQFRKMAEVEKGTEVSKVEEKKTEEKKMESKEIEDKEIEELKMKYGECYKVTTPFGFTCYVRKPQVSEMFMLEQVLRTNPIEGTYRLVNLCLVKPKLSYEGLMELPFGRIVSISTALYQLIELTPNLEAKVERL